METKRNLWYFGLEPLKERYTHQLSEIWMPETFKDKDVNFISLKPNYFTEKISTGFVLDSTGRGIYSMQQCEILLNHIRVGNVQNDDIIFLQDFWTPGFESILYALHLAGIKVKIYSMLHAQSVDEYDFTHGMKNWMRHFELGLDEAHSGIFVGSTIHKDQLRQAGFKAPIHVVGLPIHKSFVSLSEHHYEKENIVIFSSRFDKEKNPFFLIEVAKRFLQFNPDWKFIVTTSADVLRSSISSVPEVFKAFAREQPNFVIKESISKSEYYEILQRAKIQFNCSLQDYVSWTMLEASYFDCGLIYPNFRSFPEILEDKNLYKAFDVNDAVSTLCAAAINPLQFTTERPVEMSDLGRQFEACLVLNDIPGEFNIWHESEYIKHLIDENNCSGK